MNQAEKRVFLIKRLLDEDRRYRGMVVPADAYEQKRMLRSLMNIRRPQAIDAESLTMQDEYLRQELEDTGITRLDGLEPVCGDLYLWQGDITRLQCGAIVNAANSGMTGCYVPCHACIDNCIHTFAGIQLRLDCAELMELQGHEEPTGQAKITKAYNLPCDHVLHTVGPIIEGRVTPEDERLLASCYRHIKVLAEHSILTVVGENRIRGTVESVYQLNKEGLATEDEGGNAVQMSLLSICASFARYFAGDDVDPKRDMLLLTSCTLQLTDEEFSGFLSEINEIALKYMKVEANESSKMRQITLISAPANEQR